MQYNDWQEIIAGHKKHPVAEKDFTKISGYDNRKRIG